MRHPFCVPLLLAALLLLPGLQASPQSTSSGPAGRPHFAVLVLDAQGAVVRDLRSEDFAVEVAGKTQSLQARGPESQGPSPQPGCGLVVVVIDTMHTSWVEEKDVRANAGRYLAASAKQDAPVSLLLFSRDGVLIPVHEYTAGSATLNAALEQADATMHHRGSTAVISPEVQQEAQRLVEFYRGEGRFSSQRAIEAHPGAVLGGFRRVAQYVSGIPGRKSLIWISSTFPFAADEKQGEILSPTTQSLAAGRLVYPNLLTPDQVKELQILWKDAIGAAQSSELALYPVQTRATVGVPLNPEVINSMTTLAHMTGGMEVHSVGDFFPQFADLTEQSLGAYEVTLATDAAIECRSDWCPMKISVNRPGLHVLAPRGFFRDSAETPAAVAQAAGPAAPANTIPFTVKWKPAEDAGVKKKSAFVVTFGPDAGIPAAGSAELNVEVLVHAFAATVDKQGFSFGANAQLPQAKLEEVRSKGFVLNNAIELEPGDYTIRFVVHDKSSGRLGVLNLPLTVR